MYSYDALVELASLPLSVDNFTSTKKPVQFFLLTHAHSDHLKGLDSCGFSGHTIYCSKITKELIKQIPKYNRNLTSLKTLEENERHQIRYHHGFANITLIPARHCPGAVMFLIEGDDDQAVLVTGDIRAEPDWVDSLAKNDILFDYMTSSKRLNNIYLDTTYGYRGEPFIEMKSNSFGLQSLLELIKLYPQDEDEISFHFADLTIGYEEVWIQMVKNGHSMHVPPELNKRLKMLSNFTDYCYYKRIHKIASANPCSKFHCCGAKPENCSASLSKFTVRVKHCIDTDIKNLMALKLPLSFDQYENEASFVEELSNGSKVYTIDNIQYLLPRNSNSLLRNELKFFFSRHSSYEECRHFVSMFNVQQVYPLTESAITWEQGFQMKRQFGDLCTSQHFIYDDIFSKIYGPAPEGLDQPYVINKWNGNVFLRSWNAENHTKTTITSGEFHFLGQQTVRNQVFREVFDDDEKQVMNEQKTLVHRNMILSGINQYKVQGMIKTNGIKYLRKYWDQKENDYDHAQDTFDDTQDNDSMALAAYRENQLRAKTISILPDKSESVNESETALSKNYSQLQSSKNELKSSFIPIPQSPTIALDQVESANMTPLARQRERLLSSPISPMKQQKRTKINLLNVHNIANNVMKDENFGFFQYKLKCCNESSKVVDRLVMDQRQNL